MVQREIPLAKPFFTRKDLNEITARIEQTLQSGWLTSGHLVKEFETTFASFIGTKEAVALNSCTAALHTVLLALGVTTGDEVIVPSNTFAATANAAIYVGAKPIFADSDRETFNISPQEIAEKVSRKTKAIIVVHIAGNPCDMREIQKIADDADVTVVEDCAHAHGAEYQGAKCGTLGAAGCFSFYPTKIMTCAEGGLVTADDQGLMEKIRVLRNHGRARFGPSEIVEMGFNYRLSEVHAAIGLAQMKHLADFVSVRNKLAQIYSQELAGMKWIKPQQTRKGNLCSYYAYIVRLTHEAPINRDALMKTLSDEGIETSIMYNPLHLQPWYTKHFDYKSGMLPVAEELGYKSLALPLYNGMKTEEVKRVVAAIKKASEERRGRSS